VRPARARIRRPPDFRCFRVPRCRIGLAIGGVRPSAGRGFQPPFRMAERPSQLLDPARILLTVQNTRRTAALNEVARLLDGHPQVANFAGFYTELLARERLDTTYIGHGIALPHARTEHVKKMVMAVGRSESGVFFETCNQTVRLMFVLGTPRSNPGDYLQLVGLLCRMLKEPAACETLFRAPTPEAFVAAMQELEAGAWT
jgi:mannitol/fructose-specific phosphotransferase system IIA component (Ntr-type)